ncbi:hypothetical protein D5S18_25465 [Nocardia panacis]|uniref:Ferredoxin n=1 Tax=Nocardia panacis TaxID=2340916 RepID=A0A3A4KFC3_9NOCA|nr:hypothetical protein [Nocardia panacis]RJO71258.1 hypothetical protein D5S18_25465 [Nocardia panacis]
MAGSVAGRAERLGAGKWAKAPDFADRPERQAEVRAQTVLDKRRYLEEGLTPLACRTCATELRVHKSSAHQTSVEWTEAPGARCPFFAGLSAQGPGRPESCPQLERTIRWAVDEGVIGVPD